MSRKHAKRLAKQQQEQAKRQRHHLPFLEKMHRKANVLSKRFGEHWDDADGVKASLGKTQERFKEIYSNVKGKLKSNGPEMSNLELAGKRLKGTFKGAAIFSVGAAALMGGLEYAMDDSGNNFVGAGKGLAVGGVALAEDLAITGMIGALSSAVTLINPVAGAVVAGVGLAANIGAGLMGIDPTTKVSNFLNETQSMYNRNIKNPRQMLNITESSSRAIQDSLQSLMSGGVNEAEMMHN